MGAHDHKELAEDVGPARCAVLTVSDAQTMETDVSGKLALEILGKFGHSVLQHRIIPNDRKAVASAASSALKEGADLVVAIGGTGVSRKDVTIEAMRDLLDKELPGFGELFRAMSHEEIGTASIMSRAVLGVTDKGRVMLAIPGAPAAVRLALEGILMNELKHLLWELRRYAP
ncbi:MAG: molybdenum cofactor biosynthesis protein MoaB [Planctomycetes bacterium]|nr:molybdenum cofactor biosynthesis protein MoaB [Planctomycetota bacterium]